MPVWRRSPLSQEQILAALTYTCVRARAECQGCAPFAIFLLGPFWGEQWPRPSHSGVSTHWPEKLKAVVRPSVRVRPAVALAIRSFSISGLTASTRPPRRRPPPPPPRSLSDSKCVLFVGRPPAVCLSKNLPTSVSFGQMYSFLLKN